MADIPRYAIAIPQNLAATGVEFTQKELTITRGCILSASKDTNREVALLAVGTEGQVLTVDASGDLAWTTLGAGHTQNTDTGTTSNTFEVSSDGTAGSLILSGASAGGDFSTTIINTTQAGDIVLTLPAVTGTLATEAYAAGLFAANDAMLYKGTIGTGGTHTIAAFNALTTYNAGWTYRVIEAGTIRGVVCQIGDLVTVIVDRAGSGNDNADFTVVQTNLDGAVIGPASVTDGYLVLFDGTTGKLIKAGTGAPGTMAYETATNYVPKSLYDAHSILYATSDNTPAALTVGEQTFVGRVTSGNIAALTAAQAMGILWQSAPASKTATGTAGWMAKDANYLYICTGTDVWARTPIATNW